MCWLNKNLTKKLYDWFLLKREQKLACLRSWNRGWIEGGVGGERSNLTNFNAEKFRRATPTNCNINWSRRHNSLIWNFSSFLWVLFKKSIFLIYSVKRWNISEISFAHNIDTYQASVITRRLFFFYLSKFRLLFFATLN